MQKNKNLKEIHIAKEKGGGGCTIKLSLPGGGGVIHIKMSPLQGKKIVMKIIYVVGDILMLICLKSSKKKYIGK